MPVILWMICGWAGHSPSRFGLGLWHGSKYSSLWAGPNRVAKWLPIALSFLENFLFFFLIIFLIYSWFFFFSYTITLFSFNPMKSLSIKRINFNLKLTVFYSYWTQNDLICKSTINSISNLVRILSQDLMPLKKPVPYKAVIQLPQFSMVAIKMNWIIPLLFSFKQAPCFNHLKFLYILLSNTLFRINNDSIDDLLSYN